MINVGDIKELYEWRRTSEKQRKITLKNRKHTNNINGYRMKHLGIESLHREFTKTEIFEERATERT